MFVKRIIVCGSSYDGEIRGIIFFGSENYILLEAGSQDQDKKQEIRLEEGEKILGIKSKRHNINSARHLNL